VQHEHEVGQGHVAGEGCQEAHQGDEPHGTGKAEKESHRGIVPVRGGHRNKRGGEELVAGEPYAVTIRPARLEDADGIAIVQVESWRDAYRGVVADDYLAALDPLQAAVRWRRTLAAAVVRTLVAEVEGRCIGYASFGPARLPTTTAAELYALYLLPAWQRRGIGRRLFRQVAATLTLMGHDAFALAVLAANPARRFYERQGAEEVGSTTIVVGQKRLPIAVYRCPTHLRPTCLQKGVSEYAHAGEDRTRRWSR
jgi:ribosomal protein S18 acetylase RimI-like enzyme